MTNLERYMNDPEMQDCDPLVKWQLFIFSLKASIHFMTETAEQAG